MTKCNIIILPRGTLKYGRRSESRRRFGTGLTPAQTLAKNRLFKVCQFSRCAFTLLSNIIYKLLSHIVFKLDILDICLLIIDY